MADKKEYIDEPIDKKKEEEAKKIAVSLSYDIDRPERAPVITAAGKGNIAQDIIKIAEDNNIPLYEDKQLVELLSKLEIDTEVPQELYVLVAEVLAFVYRLDRMSSKKEQVEQKIQEKDSKKITP